MRRCAVRIRIPWWLDKFKLPGSLDQMLQSVTRTRPPHHPGTTSYFRPSCARLTSQYFQKFGLWFRALSQQLTPLLWLSYLSRTCSTSLWTRSSITSLHPSGTFQVQNPWIGWLAVFLEGNGNQTLRSFNWSGLVNTVLSSSIMVGSTWVYMAFDMFDPAHPLPDDKGPDYWFASVELCINCSRIREAPWGSSVCGRHRRKRLARFFWTTSAPNMYRHLGLLFFEGTFVTHILAMTGQWLVDRPGLKHKQQVACINDIGTITLTSFLSSARLWSVSVRDWFSSLDSIRVNRVRHLVCHKSRNTRSCLLKRLMRLVRLSNFGWSLKVFRCGTSYWCKQISLANPRVRSGSTYIFGWTKLRWTL